MLRNITFILPTTGILLIYIVLLNLFCCTVGVRTVSAQTQTVKIGYYYDSDYYYKDTHGDYRGYDVEYYYEIAKYTNWQYKYVDFNSFEEAYAALEEGKIDLLPALFYTQKRADTLLLSNSDMGSIYVTLIVSPKNRSVAYGDTEALQGKKIGILSEAVDGEVFREWAKGKGLDAEITSMASTEELLENLDSGGLDAVAISYLGTSNNYRVIAEFSPMKMYFGMPKDRTGLMQELNEAMDQLAIQTPDFSVSLYNKYYIANQKQAPVFTEVEKSYIASAGTLTVALLKDNAPLSYCDASGKMHGAVVDYYEFISLLSGLKFSYLGADTMPDVIRAVQSGRADIAGNMVYDATEAIADHILLTNPYSDMALTQLSLKEIGMAERIVVPAYLSSVFSQESLGGGKTLQYHDTVAGCIHAMKKGKADAVVLSIFSADYHVNNDRVGTYLVTALNGFTYKLAAGIPDTADRTLYSILNRCIRYSGTTTINELIVKNSQANISMLQAAINRIPQSWLLCFVLIMFSLVLLLTFLLAGLKRRQKEKEILAAQQEELFLERKNTEAKNQFLSNISHDMRTPLNAILGFSDICLQEKDLEKIRDYTTKIHSSGKLLLDLINDTLTLSKVSSGKLYLKLKPVNSKKLFESITIPIREETRRKNITFTVDDSRALCRTILADELNVQKIFLNLLSNAVKYTPSGGHILLSIYNEPTPDRGPDSLIMISDDGIGISNEFLPHLFEPFSQERQNGYESVGTGLGLSIVKQLVELMGGSIKVQSVKGKGTTFMVRLHFEEVMEGVADMEPLPSRQCSLTGEKILLCEDNKLNREIFVTMLRARGINTICAGNGAEGVAKFSESAAGEYAAILMDIRMPVMDGLEATARIRNMDRADAKTIPIIALTADAFAENVQECLDAGMDGHVAKPVSPAQLYSALKSAVESGRSACKHILI